MLVVLRYYCSQGDSMRNALTRTHTHKTNEKRCVYCMYRPARFTLCNFPRNVETVVVAHLLQQLVLSQCWRTKKCSPRLPKETDKKKKKNRYVQDTNQQINNFSLSSWPTKPERKRIQHLAIAPKCCKPVEITLHLASTTVGETYSAAVTFQRGGDGMVAPGN